MKIAVIGGKGMLGRELCRAYQERHTVIPLDIEEIDITARAPTRSLIAECAPDIIINSAVMVDVDRCEQEPARAWRINAIGAQNVALAAADCNSQLIYISTDYVFDGESARDYAEYDYVNPINHYGKSKYYGEMMSARLCQRLYVVRSSWLFGHSERGYIARILAQHEQGVVRMADDQLEAPTYTAHLAAALERLWQSECYGVYHISGGRGCTRIEFARAVLAAAGLDTAVEAADRAAVLAKRVARRPARVVLDCMLYQEVCATALPTWEEGIKEYFRREPYRR